MNQSNEVTRRGESLPEQTRDRPTVVPVVDIYENQDEILLVADVPGVSKEQVSIDLNKDQLVLSARQDDGGGVAGRPRTAEYQPRDYYRAFLVPSGIDAARISAELTNGVLCVHLPKSEAVKPRRIEVRAG